MLDVYKSEQFARFLILGGSAAAVNFFSRFAYQAHLGYEGSVAAAYGTGFVLAFLLNRQFVFPASGKPLREELSWFLSFNLGAFALVCLASLLLRRYFFASWLAADLAQAAAHATAILLPIPFTFLAHRRVTFARQA